MVDDQAFYLDADGTWNRFGRGARIITPGLLPWDKPARSVMVAGQSNQIGVYAHYIGSFPTSLFNESALPDYYQTHWTPPGHTEGSTDYSLVGGFIRDRPAFVPARSNSPITFGVLNCMDEVNEAIDSGYDGFTCDLLSLSNTNRVFNTIVDLIHAVENIGDPYFKLILMPDGTAGGTSDPTTLANWILSIKSSPALKRIGGRLLIAPYGPERAPAGARSGGIGFWNTFLSVMQAGGENPLLWFCYIDSWTPLAPTYDPVAYGHGRWGPRNPAETNASNNDNLLAASYMRNIASHPSWGGTTRKWMSPVSHSSHRPSIGNGHDYQEGWCTENLRGSWLSAISSAAEMVQIPTWNDFAEGAQMRSSLNHGRAIQDIGMYWMIKFKTGNYPAIVRDGLYLIHRLQHTSGMDFTGTAQTTFASHNGTQAAENSIEVVAFLEAPGRVQILANGVPQTIVSVAPAAAGSGLVAGTGVGTTVYNGLAGCNVIKANLADGTISTTITRTTGAGAPYTAASATQAKPVTSAALWDDFDYYYAWSLRP